MVVIRFRFFVFFWPWLLMASMGLAQDARILEILYVQIERDRAPVLSGIDPFPDDLGGAGARLGRMDIASTGQFLGYEFALQEERFAAGEIDAAIAKIEASDARYVLLDMNAEAIEKVVADDDRLYFNVSAYDDALRGEMCARGLFHTVPSYAMRADAIMQFLRAKRWTHPVLLIGNQPEDAKFAEALKASAKKFQIEFGVEKNWVMDEDLRRAAASEVPLFSQEFGDYHVLIVADERNDFARYLAYNTWNPRPIVGGDGLRAVGWSRVMEQWGAVQLQERFVALAGRAMQDEDYAAWAAMRAIDEAYVRTDFGDAKAVKDYLLGDEFELAGFKGRPLSFRNWNGQMRQPIGLVTATAVVNVAPLEGFLHAENELDTLGQDRPETTCTNFGE